MSDLSRPTVSVRNAAQLLRLPEDTLPYLRHNRAAELTLEPGELTAADGEITSFEFDGDAQFTVDATGCAVIPGFVDCHTHLPFVGWRATDYEQKVTGVPYEEIARGGGGIASSATAFAESSDEQVLTQATTLADEMLMHGTTTFECKSGYGLSIEAELRSLKLAERLGSQVKQHTVSTALLAHAIPKDSTADEWLDQVETALPQIVDQTSIEALDIYVESVAFTNSHLMRMGELARRHGLALRCHVEQFNTHHSVPVAVAQQARSVDHLACMHIDDLPGLAKAECAAVLLPGAEFLGQERTPRARDLANAGAICVLGTDANPGTSPVVSMPLIIGLAVRRYGWSVKEALLASTLNAAWTIDRSSNLGSLEKGKQADFLLLDGPAEHIPYRFGHNPVAACFIGGQPVYVRPDARKRIHQQVEC